MKHLRLIIVLIVGVVVTSCDSGRERQEQDAFFEIRNSGTMTVGYVVLTPWVERDPNTGELSGAYIDLMDEIGRISNIDVQYVETQWSTFAAGLNTGQFDVSIVPSYVTIERANAMNFTRPLSSLGNSVIVRDDSLFADVSELNQEGVQVVVIQGEQGHDYALANLRLAEVTANSSGDFNLLYTEVLTGRADAAFGDVVSIARFVEEHPGVRDINATQPYSFLEISWAVRQQDLVLKDFLDNSIRYLDGSGTLQAVNERYGL